MYGSENKSYNDYSIEQTEDGFRYVFSFKDPSKSNTYSIVTLNRQGQPTVVDLTSNRSCKYSEFQHE